MKKIVMALSLLVLLCACQPEASPEAKFDTALTELEENDSFVYEVVVTYYEDNNFTKQNKKETFETKKTDSSPLASFASFNTPLLYFDSFSDQENNGISFQISQKDLDTFTPLFNDKLVEMTGLMTITNDWSMTDLVWNIKSDTKSYTIEITKK